MRIKRISIFLVSIISILIIYVIYLKYFKIENKNQVDTVTIEEKSYSSNTIQEVNYISKDARGNEYNIDAKTGEIDINNPDIIYLTDVRAFINLENSEKIHIKSDFGKYNTKNFDTIFSKNVIITYLDHKITGEYLDFSMKKNLMVISRNIIYTSLENILKADVLEMNIQTKDTIIYMYEEEKKIKVKSKD